LEKISEGACGSGESSTSKSETESSTAKKEEEEPKKCEMKTVMTV
jgi:hypothetical protein